MRSGCLLVLGGWLARTCWRLGARLAYVLITMITFLLLGVIGPLCLGMTRGVVRRLTTRWRDRDSLDRAMLPSSRLNHALLGGTLWVAGYIIVSGTVRVISSVLAAAVSPSHRFIIATGLVFIIGGVVGALAFEYEEVQRFRR